MQVRFGRYGKFLGCSGYPECKTIKKPGRAAAVSLGIACPGLSAGRAATEAVPARQDFLQLQPVPQVQVCPVGQTRVHALPAVSGAPLSLKKRPSGPVRFGAVFVTKCDYTAPLGQELPTVEPPVEQVAG